jgi:Zn-dependent oligopeptidase
MQNPLLTPGQGHSRACRPSNRVSAGDFKPALEEAMAEHLAEIERIAGDPSPPTFENTIAALERSGRTLDRVLRVYNVFATTMISDAFQAVEREMEPKLAAFDDCIIQNEPLSGASRPSTKRARIRGFRPSSSVSRGSSTPSSPAAAQSWMRQRRNVFRRSTSASPGCTRNSDRTCSPTRRAMS